MNHNQQLYPLEDIETSLIFQLSLSTILRVKLYSKVKLQYLKKIHIKFGEDQLLYIPYWNYSWTGYCVTLQPY